jgi:aminomethyltransferase
MEQSKVNTMRSPLYQTHQQLGAKIVNFNGWQMPIQYAGILTEHEAVRKNVGLFDVSHMGRLLIEGTQAEDFLDYLSTNHIKGKENQTATYTVWTNEAGGCVDDVLIYKEDKNRYFVIVNAGNRDKDLAHVMKYAKDFAVTVSTRYEDEGILALQGPRSLDLIHALFPETAALKHFHFLRTQFNGESLIISRTGYTGEKGVEIYAPANLVIPLWEQLLAHGKQYNIQPVGLGARDTLRLEMGYALYGHELTETIAATESVSHWTVKWDKENFIGKKALESLNTSNRQRHAYGAILNEKAIAREGFAVYQNEKKIGSVTSGGFAPSLNQSIALVISDSELSEGDQISIEIRNKHCAASIARLPFYHPNKTT